MRNGKWIVTEHRQIVVDCNHHPLEESDAFRIALDDSIKSYIVSDKTTRSIYPVHDSNGKE
jgi:inner membrane protein involved in colicin E2 resistance